MRTWAIGIALIAATLVCAPLSAHPTDSVMRAERVGRWLQLEPTQVEQLARFITETQLQRRSHRQILMPELLAVLEQHQKAQLAELVLTRQLRLPRGRDVGEAKLSRLQEALALSPNQVDELRRRSEQVRAENLGLMEERKQELAAIVGPSNASKIIARLEQRRGQRANRR